MTENDIMGFPISYIFKIHDNFFVVVEKKRKKKTPEQRKRITQACVRIKKTSCDRERKWFFKWRVGENP